MSSETEIRPFRAFPIREHRAEVVAAFEEAIARVDGEPGVDLYALRLHLTGLKHRVGARFAHPLER